MTGSASARLFVLGFFLTAVTLSAHATTTPKKKVVYGTAIVFLGWSPDSKYVAYTWPQTRRGAAATSAAAPLSTAGLRTQ